MLEIPGEGDYVGIDAEFINVGNEHGRKSVGRVSCVNSTGEQILIDDYVVTCEKIQVGIHDSVEDARVALKLFRKWEELNRDGTLESVLNSLYTTGKQLGWRVDHAPQSKSSSPLSETRAAGASPPLE
ncbi:hypothetical protein TELCIR_09335 [Teladorsagia circumcincta]|uniref:Exonuclease domain-containing protein n=1 Tax=Teladorsagia circumcincta TaxID=45464 RepID=A0A2G9UF43_TELCI|nr:hypothetical protein TELCIR_09335 [Teladorsagia circumcincta]